MKKSLLVVVAILVIAVSCFAFVGCNKAPLTIGTQNGTTGFYYASGDADWGFDGIKGATVKGYENAGLAVKDMLNKNADFVIIDEAPAAYLVKSIKGIKMIKVPLTIEEYAFGVDKAQPELLAKANTFIAKIMEDGTLSDIVGKYMADGAKIEGIVSATKDDAKKDKQLVVATNAAFAPFEYKIGDKFAGIDIEIAKLLADELDMELVIADMDFDAVVTSVGKNNVDIAMSGLTVNETRKQSVNFATPYYKASQYVICPSDCTIFDNIKLKDDYTEDELAAAQKAVVSAIENYKK